jgi:hypothetical protein
MKRRQFVLGLGAVTASGATLLGSGAFTSVSADRTISVETAQDSEAFLELDARGDAERSAAGDTVEFEFPSLAEQVGDDVNPQNPQGLGRDSVYRFASDVDGRNGLLQITNNGTQSVDVFAEQQTSGDVPEIDIFDVETGDLLTSGSPGTLDVGELNFLNVGFRIDTTGVDTDEHDIDLTIVADA